MRQITRDAAVAFNQKRNFKLDNTLMSREERLYHAAQSVWSELWLLMPFVKFVKGEWVKSNAAGGRCCFVTVGNAAQF
jgi:hypothetical protein